MGRNQNWYVFAHHEFENYVGFFAVLAKNVLDICIYHQDASLMSHVSPTWLPGHDIDDSLAQYSPGRRCTFACRHKKVGTLTCLHKLAKAVPSTHVFFLDNYGSLYNYELLQSTWGFVPLWNTVSSRWWTFFISVVAKKHTFPFPPRALTLTP